MPQRMFETCQVEGCERVHKARGYCSIHYQHHLRGVPINPVVKTRDRNPPPECTEADCHSAVVGRGLCQMHYARFLRHGHTRYRDRKKPPKICAAPGCESYVYAKGKCHQHWYRQYHMLRKHGLTETMLTKMEAAQDGVCAICHTFRPRPNWRSGKPEMLNVDHDHETNKVRGLLCDGCNRGIGLLGDSIETVRSALAYLERHKPPE